MLNEISLLNMKKSYFYKENTIGGCLGGYTFNGFIQDC